MKTTDAEFCPYKVKQAAFDPNHTWVPTPELRLDGLKSECCAFCPASRVILAGGLPAFVEAMDAQCADLWAFGFYAAWDIRDGRERQELRRKSGSSPNQEHAQKLAWATPMATRLQALDDMEERVDRQRVYVASMEEKYRAMRLLARKAV